jgi:uncharacterized protein YodC (DUF2158 family)
MQYRISQEIIIMSNKYAVGTNVKLKSGGPVMTVKSYKAPSQLNAGYTCQWFAGKKLENGTFPEDSLNEEQEE